MVGKWIDERSDAERDRIIEAQHWTYAAFDTVGGDRCLVLHALGSYAPISRDIYGRGATGGLTRVIVRYDNLCERFGLRRIVRAVKLRAARSSIVHLTQVVQT